MTIGYTKEYLGYIYHILATVTKVTSITVNDEYGNTIVDCQMPTRMTTEQIDTMIMQDLKVYTENLVKMYYIYNKSKSVTKFNKERM